MSYQDENNKLAENFFNTTFGKSWSTPPDKRDNYLNNYSSLEIDINYKCNLGCKYCYVARYGEQLYPKSLYEDEDKIMNNLELLLDWLLENNYRPKLEIFSGEPLIQPISFKVIDRILDKIGNINQQEIVIPTNYSFLLSDSLTQKVKDLIKKGDDVGMKVVLSASVDGKYCEINRPFKAAIKSGTLNPARDFDWEMNEEFKDPRGDEFYKRFFEFQKEYSFGFHPMVYSENIDKWRDNFLWFQENFKKYDINWMNIYLLEVRNSEWTLKQCKEFAKFTEFLVKFAWDKCRNYNDYKKFMFAYKGFNILNSPLGTVGRGLGCSIQSSIQLRLGDLNIMPCHRTCYPHLMIGKLRVKNNKISGINIQSPELWIGINTADSANFPYCEQCGIRNICSRGCLGAQIETTGDLFTPVPSMCRMEHWKLKGMIKAYKDIGIFNRLIDDINPNKKESFKYLGGLI